MTSADGGGDVLEPLRDLARRVFGGRGDVAQAPTDHDAFIADRTRRQDELDRFIDELEAEILARRAEWRRRGER